MSLFYLLKMSAISSSVGTSAISSSSGPDIWNSILLPFPPRGRLRGRPRRGRPFYTLEVGRERERGREGGRERERVREKKGICRG